MRHATLLILLALTTRTDAQTQPAASDMDWLLSVGTATTVPSTPEPDAPARSPLVGKPTRDLSRAGTVQLSDGTTLVGRLSTTPDKPLRFWDEEKKEYLDIPFSRVKSLEAEVVWERDEKEWAFKQAGADDKVFTGRTYPARELIYTLETTTGRTVRESIVAPLQYDDPTGKKSRLLVLHKRDKGPAGTTLAELVYVKSVQFEEPRTK
jgi:hypothetical protein